VIATSLAHSSTKSGGDFWLLERKILRLARDRFALKPRLTRHRLFRHYPHLDLP
jgi:hypothetical protein